MRLKRLANMAWNICQPDQHKTVGNYVKAYYPSELVSHVIRDIKVSVIGRKNRVTTIETPDLNTCTGHIHLNRYLENE